MEMFLLKFELNIFVPLRTNSIFFEIYMFTKSRTIAESQNECRSFDIYHIKNTNSIKYLIAIRNSHGNIALVQSKCMW